MKGAGSKGLRPKKVYLCLTRRKQGEDPAVDVTAVARTTPRNIDNCVIDLAMASKMTSRWLPGTTASVVLNSSITSNKILHGTRKLTKSNATFTNSAVLQHSKKLSPYQANHRIFNRHIFNSCDIGQYHKSFCSTWTLQRCNVYR